jgi:hypothetical protein
MDERMDLMAAEALAVLTAEAIGGELQSVEPRGMGTVAVILIGTTPWRVQLDPLERRDAPTLTLVKELT